MNNNYVKIAYHAIDEKKGADIKVLDISSISSIADYFIITNGSNIHQVQAICDSVSEELGKNGCHYKSIEGYESGSWILMDYGDIIIHIFNREERHFYDLERIWRDGRLVTDEELI